MSKAQRSKGKDQNAESPVTALALFCSLRSALALSQSPLLFPAPIIIDATDALA